MSGRCLTVGRASPRTDSLIWWNRAAASGSAAALCRFGGQGSAATLFTRASGHQNGWPCRLTRESFRHQPLLPHDSCVSKRLLSKSMAIHNQLGPLGGASVPASSSLVLVYGYLESRLAALASWRLGGYSRFRVELASSEFSNLISVPLCLCGKFFPISAFSSRLNHPHRHPRNRLLSGFYPCSICENLWLRITDFVSAFRFPTSALRFLICVPRG